MRWREERRSGRKREGGAKEAEGSGEKMKGDKEKKEGISVQEGWGNRVPVLIRRYSHASRYPSLTTYTRQDFPSRLIGVVSASVCSPNFAKPILWIQLYVTSDTTLRHLEYNSPSPLIQLSVTSSLRTGKRKKHNITPPPPTYSPSHSNPRRTTAGQNPQTKTMSGKYGMFSKAGDPTQGSPSPQRDESGTSINNNNKTTATPDPETGIDRAESPLFEPEDPPQDFEALLRPRASSSPTPPPFINPYGTREEQPEASSAPAVRKRPMKRNKSHPFLDSSDSDSSCTLADEDVPGAPPVSATNMSTDKMHTGQEEDVGSSSSASLTGNVAVMDEYLRVVEALSACQAAKRAEMRRMQDDREEEMEIEAALKDLEADQTDKLAKITKDCVEGIKEDMNNPTISTRLPAIHRAVQDRFDETKKDRGAVIDFMNKTKEELKEMMEIVKAEKVMAVQARKATFDEEEQKLEKRKAELEAEGGPAMAFELGKKMPGPK
ncbi:hypothetical protein BDW02DRAFT_624585 [Decorospora gaudefroyi]|uniref:Uncharacterized protein n=1 Tax=Decorospora gaudefroyi TaxID=184978 RepID=A0A6A5K9G7_9PLEO|nr:hypothetical protein BDW02DRAFT_624585 [Decorospora gaudefroyi]